MRLPAQTPREATAWTEDELRKFLHAAAGDRLHAAWLLSALGLRHSEVPGLRWSDISFAAGTATIRQARVLTGGKVVEKSRRSSRTLPLFEPLSGALAALEARQRDEMDAADPAYRASGYVVVDETGEPLNPERYSHEFGRLRHEARVRPVRLHDLRATMNSLLEQGGQSDSLRAAWLGHTVTVNVGAYLAKPADLAGVGAAVGRILGPV